MNKAKVVLIILGLLVLAAAAYYAVPYFSTVSAGTGVQVSGSIDDSAVKMLESFTAKLESAPEYSLRIVKTVAGSDSARTMIYSYTAKGKDYAIEAEYDGNNLRQLYKNGKYVFVNDTAQTYYPDANNIGVPDVHFLDALAGKPVSTGSEIVNGYQRDYVRVYKDGVVYIFYFDSFGELTRFYYIYDSNEITLDFCRVVIGYCPDGASFLIPDTYTASRVKPISID